jgi:hypothetical protein
MAAGEDFAARAQAALDLISRDTLARDRFTSAYTGTGDALRSLRAAADPAAKQVTDERLDALRRIAFGRTRTAADEDAAHAARQALQDEERLRAQDADALNRAIRALGEAFGLVPDSSPLPDAVVPDDRLAPTRPASTLRRAWLVPIVALCLAAGYGSSAISKQWTAPAPAPPTSESGSVTRFPVVAPSSGAQSGSTIAADEWFGEPQAEEDTVDASTLLSDLGIDPDSTRYMGSTVHGAWLWIAKRPDRSYCVVGVRPWNGGAFGSCTSLDDFVRGGLELTQGLDSIRWDGIHFTTSSTSSIYG